jgi:hypothetical protein
MEWTREILDHPLAVQAVGLAGLALGVLVLHFLTRRVLIKGIERLVEGSRTDWDDALHRAKVFELPTQKETFEKC